MYADDGMLYLAGLLLWLMLWTLFLPKVTQILHLIVSRTFGSSSGCFSSCLLPSADDKQLVETLPNSSERDGMLQLAKQLQTSYRETQSELLEVTGLAGHQANNEILMREIKVRHFS